MCWFDLTWPGPCACDDLSCLPSSDGISLNREILNKHSCDGSGVVIRCEMGPDVSIDPSLFMSKPKCKVTLCDENVKSVGRKCPGVRVASVYVMSYKYQIMYAGGW